MPKDESEWSDSPTVLKRDSSAVLKVRDQEKVELPRLTLVVHDPSGETKVEHTGDVCRIGSHGSNDVVVKDRTVSRFHCRLVHDQAGWRVTDSGSSNGTTLDGVKV